MKKIFAWVLLLTLMLGLFAGCKKTDTPTEPTVGDYVTAEAAMEYLKALYKNTEEATPTPRDYTRYGVIRVGGEPFEVVWTVDVGEDLIKVVPGEDEMVTIDVDEQCQTDTPYVLTATITDQGGNSVSHSWNYILPKAMDVGQILKDAYALAEGESLPYEVTLTGKLISIDTMYSAEYQNITVTMAVEGYEEYPIQCYRLKGDGIDQLAVGNIITVTGTIKNYNGTIEFDSGCILESWEKGDAVDAPEDPLEIVKAAYALKDGESLPYVATLTGKVTEIDTPYDPDYSNISVVMVVEGAEDKPITCYRLKGTGADQIAVDDIITVMGIIKNYKGTIEFDTGCQMIDRISGGREAEQPSSDPAKIFADAKKLKSGQHLNYYATLTGKVTDIESPYDSEYNNITVVMTVKGYEGTPITCYRLKGTGVEKIARGDTITVKGIIENYQGKLEFGSGCTLLDRVSGGGVAKPETSNVKTIMNDAAKLSSGQHLDYYSSLTGKVIDIESPYDKEYQNITVVMQVSGYEDMPITCYRLKSGAYNVSKIAKGDTITVRGVLENYNGKLEYGSGCTLTYRKSGGGVAKPETSNVKTIMTDAAKLASGEHLDYYATLTGKVTEIQSPYDKEYGNITVVMEVKSYEDSPIICYRLKSGAYNVSKIAVGDTITVRGVLENYDGKLEFGSGCTLQKRVSGGGVAKPESSDAKTIFADAAKLADGESLTYYATLTGKVTSIDTPYDSEYGNISVYMDVNGTNLYCYRLKSGDADASKIAVGDTITVRGVIMKYDGAIQFGSGSTLQKRVSGGGVAKPESSDAKAILADAAKLADGEKLDYYANLTGKVTSIDTPYDSEYGNISVYMDVNGTSMYCYRLKSGDADASKIAVGDTITVRGVITNYQGGIQFDSGSTLTKRVSGGGVAKPESSDAAAIFADAAKLASGEHLDYYATLTGKVTEIQSPYDKEYGNITVVMEVKGYEDSPIICYRLKSGDADASKIAVGDTITVRGVLENYDGKLEFGSGCTLQKRVSGGGVAKPESSNQAEILADAAKLAEDESLSYYANLTGKVTKIDTAYDPGYGNLSLYMDLSDGTNLYCYRLKSGAADASKIRVGDTISVRGVIMNYKGDIQFGAGCTLEKLVEGYNPGDNMTAKEILDAAYALESASKPEDKQFLEGQYTLTGVISSVDTAYDSGYKNITVTMQVEGCEDQPIQAYRLASGAAQVSGLKVGDTITVTGMITKYNNKVQFDQGCVLDAVVPGEGGGSDVEIPAGSPVIHLNNVANRVSVSTTQQVWKENGITVTNDKASSSTDINGSYTNPARFYKGSTVTVEYPGMTRIVFYMDTYKDDYADQLVASLASVTGIVVTHDGRYVTVDLYEAVDSFTVPALANQIRVLEITACTGTTPPEDGGNTGGDQVTGNTPVDVPQAGVAYKWAIDQTNKGVTLYFNGEVANTYYGGTTENINEAVDVILEATTGGYYVSFVKADGTKQYVNVVVSGTHRNFTMQNTASTVYTYNSEYKTLVTNVDGTDCYIGTYDNYNTFSVSTLDKISTSFPAYFCTPGGNGGIGGGGNTGGGTTPDVPGGEIIIPAGSPTLSFKEESNRTSYSGEQQVWQQNGITLTNDKASSAQDVNSAVNPVRLYANTTVNIAYPGMTRIVFDVAFEERVEPLVSSLEKTAGVTVTVNGLTVAADFAETDSLTFNMVAQTRLYGLTVCTGTTGGNQGGTTEPDTPVTPVGAPQAGVAYKWAIDQGNKGVTLYFNGEVANTYYGGTTENIEDAVDVILENTNGGYYVSFVKADGTKQYVNVVVSGTHRNFTMQNSASTVYTYNEQYNTLVTNVDGTDCYIGTYGTYSTFSVSTLDKISTSFPAYFVGTGSGNQGGTTPDVPVTPPAGGTLDPNDLEALLEAAAKLENGQYLDVETTQTGVISMVPVYNASYGSYTFSMDVDGTEVYCYSIEFAEGVEPKKGDTVTITGKLTAYNGGPQFDYTSTATWVKAGEVQEEGVTYTFSQYAAGDQYAENEVHVLDDVVTVTTNEAHFTTQLRLYNSSDGDGTAVIASTKAISKIVLSAGYKNNADLTIYGSNDGVTYEEVAVITTTSASYLEYAVELAESYKYLKLDATTDKLQVRIQYMTLTFAE